jgi:histidyl-tRNA synthetase
MIRIRDTRFTSTGAFLTEALRIASYYGFVPLEAHPRVQDAKRAVPTIDEIEDAISFARRDERPLSSVARKAATIARGVHGVLGWRIVQNPGAVPSVSLELHVIGHPSAMAEAMLIVVADAIASEAGIAARTLSINSIGSSESSGRYSREVGTYLRKHLESISPSLRPRIAQDPIGALVQLIERGHPSITRAPQATEYLSEEERKRFWEFLEYLEVAGLPYELSGHVLGSRDVWAHTLFEIATLDAETGVRLPIAFGGRYDPLMSRFAKRPDSAAVVSITCEVRGSARAKEVAQTPPPIFFAHIGIESRRKALSVIETLRRADIPVHQSLTYDRLGDQMTRAKTLGVPYILILGHKEAVENAILVREVATNSQEAVPIEDLTGYLKRRRFLAQKPEVAA